MMMINIEKESVKTKRVRVKQYTPGKQNKLAAFFALLYFALLAFAWACINLDVN